jgi:hypothetical protein
MLSVLSLDMMCSIALVQDFSFVTMVERMKLAEGRPTDIFCGSLRRYLAYVACCSEKELYRLLIGRCTAWYLAI